MEGVHVPMNIMMHICVAPSKEVAVSVALPQAVIRPHWAHAFCVGLLQLSHPFVWFSFFFFSLGSRCTAVAWLQSENSCAFFDRFLNQKISVECRNVCLLHAVSCGHLFELSAAHQVVQRVGILAAGQPDLVPPARPGGEACGELAGRTSR